MYLYDTRYDEEYNFSDFQFKDGCFHVGNVVCITSSKSHLFYDIEK